MFRSSTCATSRASCGDRTAGVSPRHWRCLGVSPDDVVITRVDDAHAAPAAGTAAICALRGHERPCAQRAVQRWRARRGAGLCHDGARRDERSGDLPWSRLGSTCRSRMRRCAGSSGAMARIVPFVPPAVGTSVTIVAQHFAFGDLLGAQRPQRARRSTAGAAAARCLPLHVALRPEGGWALLSTCDIACIATALGLLFRSHRLVGTAFLFQLMVGLPALIMGIFTTYVGTGAESPSTSCRSRSAACRSRSRGCPARPRTMRGSRMRSR